MFNEKLLEKIEFEQQRPAEAWGATTAASGAFAGASAASGAFAGASAASGAFSSLG